MSKRFKDLSGQRFGKLLVIKRVDNHKVWTMFLCLCDCGKETIKYSTHLVQGLTTSCGCAHPMGKDSYGWKGCGDITGNMWYNISHHSKRPSRQNIPFEITIEYAWALFLKQNRKCALSGIELTFSRKSRETTASLDRIKCVEGYIDGNVQWVHKDVNRMKNIFDQQYFIKTCNLIAENSQHGT